MNCLKDHIKEWLVEQWVINEECDPTDWDFKSFECKLCGKYPLHWENVSDKWIMFEDDNNHHNCPKSPLPMDLLAKIESYKLNRNIKS